MILPVMAIVLSVFFQGVYTWRTFFMVHSGEDYVELAKAKGLPGRVVRQRYLLRPTLPSIITSFALMLMSFWEAAIALELLFGWPGLGAIFYRAVYAFDRPVVVAIVVMFAYLLGFSVILLDVLYALIDPRVRLGSNGLSTRMHMARKKPLKRVGQFFNRIWTQVSGSIVPRTSRDSEDTQPVLIRAEDLTRPVRVNEDQKIKNLQKQLEDTQPVQATLETQHGVKEHPLEKTQPIRIKPQREKYFKSLFLTR